MKTDEKLLQLRRLMKAEGIDAYIVPSPDAHQSEYVGEHWKCRQWISGFTGSAGTAVVTANKAGLWTDGRYFIQAANQLKGSGMVLFKSRQPGVPDYPEWLCQMLPEGACVGFDGKVFSAFTARKLEEKFKSKSLSLKTGVDLIDRLWTDRPPLADDKAFILPMKYAGKSRIDKLAQVRELMKEKGTDYYLLPSLDDICWLFNMRGNDIPYNPYVTAYAVIGATKAWLFVDSRKIDGPVRRELENDGVILREYGEIAAFLNTLKGTDAVAYDPQKANCFLCNSIAPAARQIEADNLTTLLKAVKNPVEIENIKDSYIKDGVALVRLFKWLGEHVGRKEITEYDVAEKAEQLRSELPLFVELSFGSICAYGENAAMMHYMPNKETAAVLKNKNFFLIDSGSHFYNGTTDITRTVSCGALTEEQKRDFTLVLKAVVAMSSTKFLYGATGSNLDVLARRPLWEAGLDYKCGSGHGVGYFSNVHEEPQRFAQAQNDIRLEKGMTITIEPGIYKEGRHGIRTENTLLVVEDEKTEDGQFMRFETLCYVPIDRSAIVPEMLTDFERQWLNDYHRQVYDKLSPHLDDEHKQWLKEQTRAII